MRAYAIVVIAALVLIQSANATPLSSHPQQDEYIAGLQARCSALSQEMRGVCTCYVDLIKRLWFQTQEKRGSSEADTSFKEYTKMLAEFNAYFPSR
jgi:hypothetical protein